LQDVGPKEHRDRSVKSQQRQQDGDLCGDATPTNATNIKAGSTSTFTFTPLATIQDTGGDTASTSYRQSPALQIFKRTVRYFRVVVVADRSARGASRDC
jgi:hypothetical protein